MCSTPDLNVIASAPADETLTGKPFPTRLINGLNVAAILEAAQTGDKNYYAQSLSQPDGSRIVAFPCAKAILTRSWPSFYTRCARSPLPPPPIWRYINTFANYWLETGWETG
jgi:hypothetical protein